MEGKNQVHFPCGFSSHDESLKGALPSTPSGEMYYVGGLATSTSVLYFSFIIASFQWTNTIKAGLKGIHMQNQSLRDNSKAEMLSKLVMHSQTYAYFPVSLKRLFESSTEQHLRHLFIVNLHIRTLREGGRTTTSVTGVGASQGTPRFPTILTF